MRRLLRGAVLLLAVAGIAAAGLGWGYSVYTSPGPLAEETTVVVPRGAGVEAIARRLAEAGVIDDPTVFAWGVRLTGAGRRLRAGEYAFPAAVSPREVAEILTTGKTVLRRLTVAEGLTVAEVVALLEATDGLVGRVDPLPEEGSLLPETYYFSYGDSRQEIVRRMARAMDEALGELWRGRAPDLPFRDPREALILASIVEKETALAAERPRIAATFINRLRRGMRLQSDPTVVYGLTGGKGPLGRELTRADLAKDHPYNTYTRDGLPPGPISNPGRESIAAVMAPADTDDLYFVADGSGGHVFARTLREHNRNVARWRRLKAGGGRKPAAGGK